MSSTLCPVGFESLSNVLVAACAKPWSSAITCSKPPDIRTYPGWQSVTPAERYPAGQSVAIGAGLFLARHFSFLTFVRSTLLPFSLPTAQARTLQNGPGCRASAAKLRFLISSARRASDQAAAASTNPAAPSCQQSTTTWPTPSPYPMDHWGSAAIQHSPLF